MLGTPNRGPARRSWPTANQYSLAVQNPSTAFQDQTLAGARVALDRLGLPLVMSGNFAYVFKLNLADGGARAVKCFRADLGDRGRRYHEVDAFLDRAPMEQLADFEYDTQGIRVDGQWYPAVVMQWIVGSTLDVAVAQMLKTGSARDGLLSLATEWVEVVAKLEAAKVAHGDLQHGNIIVTTGGLRLVDLDGMFVPSLRGSGAAGELGHRHFQHPKRTLADFDERLDRFSGLVIYTSLVALAERPDLWKEFNDDNLIFTRGDFEAPQRSRLFTQLARMSAEVQRVARPLEQACQRGLADVPQLTSLVATKKRAPLWVREPVVKYPQPTTREAPPAHVPQVVVTGSGDRTPGVVSPARPPWRWSAPGTAPLTGPASPPVPATPVPAAADDDGQLVVGVVFAGGVALACGCLGLWKYPVGAGLAVVVAFVWGYFQSANSKPLPLPASTGSSTSPPPPPPAPTVGSAPPPWTRAPQSGPVVVMSSIRGIYHLPSCEWARRISARHRTFFSDPARAERAGFRACRVCRP